MSAAALSHLLQMRGLKLVLIQNGKLLKLSHLLQMRGLKHVCKYDQSPRLCRIFYRCVD